MSITKRIIDMARSNLNSLLEKAADTMDPRRRLANIPDEELEAELRRRRAAREAENRLGAARAKVDESYEKDRAERERMAREREARVRGTREKREQAERAARETEARRRAQSSARSSGPRPGGSSSSSGSSQRSNVPRGGNPELAQYYARLELAYGADYAAVKASYRRLMRKYHPDLHGGSPERHRAATEVSQQLTQAYNELEKVLLGGPNRK
ncbi:MAG TPA: J domain-containing protein [Haliangiales bacterium]|nr:J domain-containing protein [Haliangiales bacterium]